MNWNTLVNRSYVPYSNKPAACVVQATSGICYPGVRIENISFPLTISCIQAAVCICLSEGDYPQKMYVQPGYSAAPEPYWVDEFQLAVTEKPDLNALSFAPLQNQKVMDIHTKLEQLLEKAITPHSNFAVSAVLETGQGWVDGVNIEVAEWSRGLCAERVAIAKAIASGIALDNAHKIYIHTSGGDFSSPCGACRQVMAEHLFATCVELHHPDNTISKHFMNDLLPYNFSANTDLKHREE